MDEAQEGGKTMGGDLDLPSSKARRLSHLDSPHPIAFDDPSSNYSSHSELDFSAADEAEDSDPMDLEVPDDEKPFGCTSHFYIEPTVSRSYSL